MCCVQLYDLFWTLAASVDKSEYRLMVRREPTETASLFLKLSRTINSKLTNFPQCKYENKSTLIKRLIHYVAVYKMSNKQNAWMTDHIYTYLIVT